MRDALAVLDSISPRARAVRRPLEGRRDAHAPRRGVPAPRDALVNHRRPALAQAGARRRGPRAHAAARRRALRAGSTTAGARAALVRKPGTLDELARRRGRMNPRLSREWLRYLVTVGARSDADGWRWKIDPSLRLGGFGPWRPDWSLGAPARPPGAAARHPRHGERADGLGHDAPRSCGPTCRPSARDRHASRRPATSSTSSARARSRSSCSSSSRRDEARAAPLAGRARAAPAARRERAGRCCCCTGSASARPPRAPASLARLARSALRPSTSPATARRRSRAAAATRRSV